MKLNMVSKLRSWVQSWLSQFIQNCCSPLVSTYRPLEPYLWVYPRVDFPRHTRDGVLKCICGLPSRFHQFRLLVALASEWSLTTTTRSSLTCHRIQIKIRHATRGWRALPIWHHTRVPVWHVAERVTPQRKSFGFHLHKSGWVFNVAHQAYHNPSPLPGFGTGN